MAKKSEADELKKKMMQAKATLDDLNFAHQKPCRLGISNKDVSQTSCICDAGEKNKKLDVARELLKTGFILSRDILS